MFPSYELLSYCVPNYIPLYDYETAYFGDNTESLPPEPLVQLVTAFNDDPDHRAEGSRLHQDRNSG